MKAVITQIKENKVKVILEENGKQEVKEYELAEWVKPSYISLGEAEITLKENEVTFCKMKTLSKEEDVPQETKGSNKKDSTKNENKWEDDIVSFETLLTAAHKKKDSFSIKTECLNVDLEKKYALFKAQVIIQSEKGELVFEGHGDATDTNVAGTFIKPHFIRMAETRSIVRALRWYTNNGCAEEEKN